MGTYDDWKTSYPPELDDEEEEWDSRRDYCANWPIRGDEPREEDEEDNEEEVETNDV